MSDQKTPFSRFSLAGNLAWWIGSFFLISAILVLSWSAWLQRKDSLEAFEQLATNNAAFVDDLRYPLSPQLTSQLSDILGLSVGFYRNGNLVGDIPRPLLKSIASMAESGSANALLVDSREIAIAPLKQSEGYLVLIRQRTTGISILNLRFLLPALILALGCATLAFALGKNIVKPLRSLASWLPNLQSENDSETDPSIPEAVLQRKDEIGLLAQAMVDTRDSLNREKQLRTISERLAALGRIATSLAHEVKNPAAAIRMHADLMTENATEENRESIELIKEEVDQISDLVDQWLFVAKPRPARVGTHDLNQLSASVCDRLEPSAEQIGVTLERQFSTSPLRVEVDSRRIEQVIRNLVSNGIQAMPAGGILTVRTDPENDFARLRVSDRGSGFSDEALRRFGEPFFSEKEGGMGIGLTLSKEVAEAHRGSISASNRKDGSGATVILTIPLSSSKPADESR